MIYGSFPRRQGERARNTGGRCVPGRGNSTCKRKENSSPSSSPAWNPQGTPCWRLSLSFASYQMLQKSPNVHPQATFSTVFKNHGISHRNVGILSLFEISNDLRTLDPGLYSPNWLGWECPIWMGFLLRQPTPLIFFTCLAPRSSEFLSPSGFVLQYCLYRVVTGHLDHQNVNCCSEWPGIATFWCCREHLAQGYSLNTNEQIFPGIKQSHSMKMSKAYMTIRWRATCLFPVGLPLLWTYLGSLRAF